MVQNVIFDADGVLLLSIKVGINTMLEAIKICDLNSPTYNEVLQVWGGNLESELLPLLASRYNWPAGSVQKVVNLFLALSESTVYPQQPKLLKTLEYLSRRYNLGIASNRDAHSLDWRLRQHGIKKSLFKHIQTSDDGINKPDPRVFDKFWNGHVGFNPRQTLYVGDSIKHDLVVARMHNPPLAFIAITSGLHSTGEFVRAGVKVTHIFKSVIELPDMMHTF
ncbi:HAD-IA family hydrolase [Patescibacteria group bacterium]|nr:HAD-IA family hydrolase [Patescibacteria group bacterium]